MYIVYIPALKALFSLSLKLINTVMFYFNHPIVKLSLKNLNNV